MHYHPPLLVTRKAHQTVQPVLNYLVHIQRKPVNQNAGREGDVENVTTVVFQTATTVVIACKFCLLSYYNIKNLSLFSLSLSLSLSLYIYIYIYIILYIYPLLLPPFLVGKHTYSEVNIVLCSFDTHLVCVPRRSVNHTRRVCSMLKVVKQRCIMY